MNKTAVLPTRFKLTGLLRSPVREVRHCLGRLSAPILREGSCNGAWYTYCGTITAQATPTMTFMDLRG